MLDHFLTGYLLIVDSWAMIMQLRIQVNLHFKRRPRKFIFTPNIPVNREGQLEYKFVFFLKFIGLLFEDNVVITQGLLDRHFIDTVIDSWRDLYIKDHPDG